MTEEENHKIQQVYEQILKLLNESHLSFKDALGIIENVKMALFLASIDDTSRRYFRKV